jgi:hypothetical protein
MGVTFGGTFQFLSWPALFFGGFSISPVDAQQQPQPGAPATDVSNIPKAITDTFDRVNIRNRPNDIAAPKNTANQDYTCLLPPLTLTRRPTITAEQLHIAAKARKGVSAGLRSYEEGKNCRWREVLPQGSAA